MPLLHLLCKYVLNVGQKQACLVKSLNNLVTTYYRLITYRNCSGMSHQTPLSRYVIDAITGSFDDFFQWYDQMACITFQMLDCFWNAGRLLAPQTEKCCWLCLTPGTDRRAKIIANLNQIHFY